MRWSLLMPISALALTACMDHPPPAAAPPEVVPMSANVPLARIPATTVNAYLGSYRSGSDTITIRRAGEQLFADRSGLPAASALTMVGLGTFADASGTAFLFVPADGSGGKLRTISADGSSRDWSR